jgi:hypothetical protein
MSKTYKHKGKWYFNNGFKNRKEVRVYLFHARRMNREKGYFKEIEIKLREKILNKDMLSQLTNN